MLKNTRRTLLMVPLRLTAKLAFLYASLELATHIVEQLYLGSDITSTAELNSYVSQEGILLVKENFKLYSRPCASEENAEAVLNIIGDLGLRDFNYTDSVKPRILFIGDSITMNNGVESDKSIVNRVVKVCQERGEDYQSINGGVVDSGIADHLARIEYFVPLLMPEILVLGLYLNDSQLSHREVFHLLDSPMMSFYQNYKKYSAPLRITYPSFILLKVSKNSKLRDRFGWTQKYIDTKLNEDMTIFKELVVSSQYDWGAMWDQQEFAKVHSAIIKM